MSQPWAFPKSIRQSGLIHQVTCLSLGIHGAGVAEVEREDSSQLVLLGGFYKMLLQSLLQSLLFCMLVCLRKSLM